MNGKKSTLRLIQLYAKEYILTGVLGGIPTPIGKVLRNLAYRSIFARVGKSVYIQPYVRFIGTRTIEIGNYVRIYSGTYISNKGNRIRFEDNVSIDRGVDIRAYDQDNGHITIGEDTYIGPYVCMAGPGFIRIGKDCMIASHSSLYANNHIFDDPKRPFRVQGVSTKGIVIEDDCWLGTGVRVLDGVTIGKGSVIGAGSVVTKNIPPYSIAVGVPARVIKSRQLTESSFLAANTLRN
ncbi:acyltransferase [Aetokthonos hydrillicola Thurmond2011]|jgi:acetyltransferase-like isoleucine patch superfamily enzyme|uniref:Acyltransferase n=1 Tax=Aetokthonos hydrillicola Thurmond2011 TaxID=2712845 RepID=A0AAP5I960_9CYAN|nr:acyltransferase [Aetokthonos hydrillicola]MBO3460060.1 acyltransferase [Aetokthonos hydrillicola CCALA 1050]MBW4589541.1 acyltransferase [Aetokthonos hydrillicola CCALA 1050]MDR9896034.1 acyltransferase [Aetokthonos hydrillicola Thurmond2011]